MIVKHHWTYWTKWDGERRPLFIHFLNFFIYIIMIFYLVESNREGLIRAVGLVFGMAIGSLIMIYYFDKILIKKIEQHYDKVNVDDYTKDYMKTVGR